MEMTKSEMNKITALISIGVAKWHLSFLRRMKYVVYNNLLHALQPTKYNQNNEVNYSVCARQFLRMMTKDKRNDEKIETVRTLTK